MQAPVAHAHSWHRRVQHARSDDETACKLIWVVALYMGPHNGYSPNIVGGL